MSTFDHDARTRIFTEADAHLALAMAALEGMDDGSARDLREAHEIHQMLRKVRAKIKRRK